MNIDLHCKSVSDSNKSRAKWFGLTEHFTEQEWRNLLVDSEYKCIACGKSSDNVSIEADHVIPLARGGTNTIDNIQVLCKSCNCSKNSKSIDFRNGANSIQLDYPLVSCPEDDSPIKICVRQLAEAKGINKTQLSLRSGIAIGVVRRYWNDKTTSIDKRVLEAFCKVLDCEPGDLIRRG